MKNVGKNKSVAFISLVCMYVYVYIYIYFLLMVTLNLLHYSSLLMVIKIHSFVVVSC